MSKINTPVKESTTAQILAFPSRPGRRPKSHSEVQVIVDDVAQYHADQATQMAGSMLFGQLHMLGFDVVRLQQNEKLSAFVVEAIRALLFDYYDLEHPIQEVADQVLTESKEEDS